MKFGKSPQGIRNNKKTFRNCALYTDISLMALRTSILTLLSSESHSAFNAVLRTNEQKPKFVEYVIDI